MALAACLLYCAASSATLASAGTGPTDLGALWAPCDGTLGQCAVGATRAGGGRQRRVPAAGAGAAAADQPVHQAPPQARGVGEVRWLPSSTNCSPLPATLSRRRTLDPCERCTSAVAARRAPPVAAHPRSACTTRPDGGAAPSTRRAWHALVVAVAAHPQLARMARPGGCGCGSPRFARMTHPVMARHVQWRWRPPVVRSGGECDGVRQAHLGMSPAVLHIQQQPMVYSLVAAVGPHRRQVSAGCTQQPGLSFCSGGAASLTSPSAPSPVTL